MDFEWYYPNSKLLQVSIFDSGITFYNETVEVMGSPKYIILGYNEDNKIIGVRACENAEDNCIDFSIKKKNSYIRINDKKFIRFIESHLGETASFKGRQKKYPAKWDAENSTLYIFLEQPLS